MKRQLMFSSAFALLLSTALSAQILLPFERLLIRPKSPPTEQPVLPGTPITVEEPVPGACSIIFDETVYDYGKVEQGERVQHIFRFTNTGDEPLILSNAKGSCGCTVPSWPKDPIPPGGSGVIVVEFDTKGKMGAQSKQVTITANTAPSQSFLTIKGEIYLPSDGEKSIGEIPEIKPVEKAASNGISAFPNPTDGILWLTIKDATGQAASIEVFDGNGKLLDKIEVTDAGAEPMRLDVTNYLNGTYWLSVKVGDANRVSLPFVVAK